MDGTISTTTETNPAGTNLPTSSVLLPDEVLEKLYRSYTLKQKRVAFGCYLAASILFDLWAILVPQGQGWESIAVTSVFLTLNIILVLLLRFCGKSRFRRCIWEVAPHAAWLLAIKQLFLQLFLKGTVTPRDSLGWAVLLNFLVYVTLPVLLKYTGILLGLGSFITYINAIIGLAKKENYFWEQQIANILLLVAATAIGLLFYFLAEAKQRRAFLEAKQGLEVKMLIEEQSAEQERLLLSVLPEHVAVKMRQDLGSTNSEQFKKIYMSRHENVSILYADIVGFTAISSTYSAQDLVKILNELFARFDRLAEKYQQLRIKILGDCYYCISGAPVERPDHAVLCVHMGLSMVKAIKYVQQNTNSPVDMRVGIHTGAVLAGILGQRQWQFDVYSKDVELANKMESSGKAGRVHLSEKTLSFLNGEFEVEPAYGEKREEALRIAGLKTYFITKVLKPFCPAEHRMNGSADPKDVVIEPDGPSEILNDEDGLKTPADEESNAGLDDKESNAAEDYKVRLRKELVSRDGYREIYKDIDLLLRFKDSEIEQAYAQYRQPHSSIPLLAALIVQFTGIVFSVLVLPRTSLHFEIVIPPLVIIFILVFISVAESFPGILPAFITLNSKRFNDSVGIRKSTAIVIVLLIGISNASDMLAAAGRTPQQLNITNVSFLSSEMHPSSICLFPSYFSNFTVLILIVVSIVTQLSHLSKIALMIIIAAIHCYINVFHLDEAFRNEDFEILNVFPLKYTLSALLVAVTIALSLLARHIDKVDRVIFMWKTEVSDQKEKASDMRRRNEALVYNVLPMHVAEHFMGNRKRPHDELYSQSYAEVGVLFASMPNFSDFYSEETVNNQGLECLRFLNEVISDFDALLELSQFQDIIKIKTIGSTYMAASGLNPSRIVKPEDSIAVRWAHLSLLVEFALNLKSALKSINEQSFNHFVLKMGINHGPITAGVIGARKPHYDIWGNTVNVASRMESTGKAGAIQVTEETCQILQTFGYTFEQRGLVAVKGKGQLMTYYLQQKKNASPILPVTTMETVQEVEEPKESPPALQTGSPAHQITSVSSSTTSPNSVRLNQEYVEMKVSSVSNAVATSGLQQNAPHADEHKQQQQQQSFGGITVTDKDSKTDDGTKPVFNGEPEEADVKTPLLKDKNSTNANHFSEGEKDALLENSN
ncbi:adenylate cyclase type 3 [Toxorhynchites rutilus septentrionalis]|uniref:adenylate cyclase type 3 n=1 Tax=Toxorhynchites rutilus septentrionalis TaxID=329112 RepID=UPI00247AD84C|nr:adenylate cyclase type 3 [Toxorhynchites rutilus septentrionalis]XP_055634058.1 adenylate cyclase type 3 [Toxorhynchites rutilus septentrionalis]XP_055634059.1 adenylate cyclase type 3 [Toxorhynchites rutilus septentrionalis]XP_055634060.1 adenylate cyclase type 3 [Toxorhynchites rutilus septentrionalis]XP_055634061.1 adenylate cyclase type 3 [Toxorhynchites rutilus septentrionalis]XP_055634062.1 adenylate cyclase type 3 [Toxorhynchites rutilus septentrionalis]XP_055634063.1 adenylate cycl